MVLATLLTWLATQEWGAGHGTRHSALIMYAMVYPLPDLNTWLVTPEGGARHGAGHIVHLAGNPGVGCWAWYPTSALITNCNAGYLL